MSLGLKDSLPSLVRAKFHSAKSSGALKLASSHLSILNISGVPFQLRWCPELAKKPKGQDDNVKPSGRKIDPFENPPEDLLVANIPAGNASHIIVLNKYPIIANHFILATKHNKQQTHKLEEDDFACAYECLTDWNGHTEDGRPRRLFAFFNSGEHSGASQPHRHLQFLPVEDMQDGDVENSWSLLADTVWGGADADTTSSRSLQSNPSLPFMHFGARLPARPSGSDLMAIYSDLYDIAAEEARQFAEQHPDQLSLNDTKDGSTAISYNLAFTREIMVITPRRREGDTVKLTDGDDFVALNGTLLAGTLMVKNEESFKLLQRDNTRLESILKSIGLPPVRTSAPQL